MTKEQLLDIIKLLSALEAWAFTSKMVFPDYLHDDLCRLQAALCKEVLK